MTSRHHPDEGAGDEREQLERFIEDHLQMPLEFVNEPGKVWLADFLKSRRSGKPVRAITMEWIESAFARILDGEKPEVALNIKRRRGRQLDPKKLMTEFRVMVRLVELYNSGCTREKCIEAVWREQGVPEWLVIDVWEQQLASKLMRKRQPGLPIK